jgi:hypothetical protein
MMETIIGTKSENLAKSAITHLKIGIKAKHKKTILEAYDMSDGFEWDNVDDSLYSEWDELVDVANDILYS